MSKFRKKPVVIDAVLFDASEECCAELSDLGMDPVRVSFKDTDSPRLLIQTLEGVMAANVGDWVIRGVKGEFYPCKPDIFEQTYEPIPQLAEEGVQ